MEIQNSLLCNGLVDIRLPYTQVSALRAAQQVKASGFDPPRPVKRFDQCGFGPRLLAAIKKQGYAILSRVNYKFSIEDLPQSICFHELPDSQS